MRNPLAIDKQKVQNLPDPGGSSGGSDVQRETITADITDTQNDQNPYVPPLPVPLARQVERKEGQRGESSEIWLVNPPAALPGNGVLVGGGNAEKGSQFPINSIRIDNLTSQWIYFPENGAWVPPFWYGRVMRYDASKVQRVRFETPTGITALAAASTNIARVVFSEEYWDEQSGASVGGNISSLSTGAPNIGVTIFDDLSGLPAEVQIVADALANQAGLVTDSFLMGYNGASWDKLRTASVAGSPNTTQGILAVSSALWESANVFRVAGNFAIATDTDPGNRFPAVGLMLATDTATSFRARVANIFKQINNVALGAGSTATVWTPAAGKKPRLMGWVVDGVSGLVDAAITFFETSTTGTFMGDVGYIAGLGAPSYVSYGNTGPIVSTSSAVIVAFSSTAVTFRGTLWGTEE